jgi:hypothetical protein
LGSGRLGPGRRCRRRSGFSVESGWRLGPSGRIRGGSSSGRRITHLRRPWLREPTRTAPRRRRQARQDGATQTCREGSRTPIARSVEYGPQVRPTARPWRPSGANMSADFRGARTPPAWRTGPSTGCIAAVATGAAPTARGQAGWRSGRFGAGPPRRDDRRSPSSSTRCPSSNAARPRTINVRAEFRSSPSDSDFRGCSRGENLPVVRLRARDISVSAEAIHHFKMAPTR